MSAEPLDDQIRRFAEVLYEPDDIVEVRALRGKGEAQSEWCKASELADVESGIRLWVARHAAEKWNVYVGANPRSRMGGSTATDVALAHTHFVDFDGIGPDRARELIAAAGLPPPSLVIASGHGCHAYWRLREPVTDLARWTGIQKRLIGMLGSDRVVHDPPRIMRLPGTTNWKDEPPVPCTIVDVGANQVILAVEPVQDGQRYLPAAESGSATGGSGGQGGPFTNSNLSKATLTFVAFGACKGSRNPNLFKAACDLIGNGATFDEACSLLVEPARRCGLEDWEIERTIRSAASKPRTPSRLPSPGSGHGEGSEGDDQDAGDDKKSAQRDLIVALARERYRFSRSLEDEPFAVAHDGPNMARMLRSGKCSLRSELARRYSLTMGKVPSSGALADAMQVLEGDCMAAEPEKVCIRLGRHGEAIVLDLGGHQGHAVVVDARGWTVVDRSPIVFRRTALIGAMPRPVAGGSLELVRKKLNISEAVWALALGWLIASLIPDIEHAIVLLGGQQDAGKSTSAKFLAGLVDASPAPLRCPPRDLEQWAVAAAGSWVVVLDNISGIAEWLSDALCRAVTGEGLPKRALYTDDIVSLLVFQRCLILTSIDTGALKGDLGRRLAILEVEPVGNKKRPPRLLKQEYERDRPAMLGAVLDLLVKVLAVLPTIELEEFVGLADFEQVLAAMDKVLGTNSLNLYRAQWDRLAADVVDDDAVATAVKTFAERNCAEREWVGTAGALLKSLAVPEPRPRKWPETARALSGQLRRAMPALRALGVEVIAPTQTEKSREYVLRMIAPTARPPQNHSPGPSTPLPQPGDRQSPPPDRPINRPDAQPHCVAGNGVLGRSGDEGGHSPIPSATPAACRNCGRKNWWSVREDEGALTCGTCHPPAPGLKNIEWLKGAP